MCVINFNLFKIIKNIIKMKKYLKINVLKLHLLIPIIQSFF